MANLKNHPLLTSLLFALPAPSLPRHASTASSFASFLLSVNTLTHVSNTSTDNTPWLTRRSQSSPSLQLCPQSVAQAKWQGKTVTGPPGHRRSAPQSPWLRICCCNPEESLSTFCTQTSENKSLIDNFSIYFCQGDWKHESLFIREVSIDVNFLFLFLC